MVWGCMGESGVGELKLVSGCLCVKDRSGLLMEALQVSVCISYTVTGHSAKYTKNWTEVNSITLLNWWAQSPDLNPIQHL